MPDSGTEDRNPRNPDPTTQVSVWLGKDTLERLDAIVERGHFGGRGRALDALLDALTESVDDINQWNLAWRHTVSPTVTDSPTRLRFEAEMRAHTMRVWGRLERFFEFAEWDSPPLPSQVPPRPTRRFASKRGEVRRQKVNRSGQRHHSE